MIEYLNIPFFTAFEPTVKKAGIVSSDGAETSFVSVSSEFLVHNEIDF